MDCLPSKSRWKVSATTARPRGGRGGGRDEGRKGGREGGREGLDVPPLVAAASKCSEE